jgi:hypothetical protein
MMSRTVESAFGPLEPESTVAAPRPARSRGSRLVEQRGPDDDLTQASPCVGLVRR